MMEDIDLIILAGFLGSGKTSLLLDAVGARDASDTAIIVNEAGEINIDGIILEDAGTSVPMAFLSNGCVCCSIGSELLATIETLILGRAALSLPPLRRIIVEASGLSKPGAILRQLGALSRHRIRARVVATLDCTRFEEMLAHEEAIAQLTGASIIVLTKLDISAPADIMGARLRAMSLNPLARLIEDRDGHLRSQALFGDGTEPLLHNAFPHASQIEGAHPEIVVWCRELGSPPMLEDILAWTDNLAGACGERLLRLKATIQTADGGEGVLLQSVGTTFSAPRLLRQRPERSFLVAIVRGMAECEIAAVEPSLHWIAPARPRAASSAPPLSLSLV